MEMSKSKPIYESDVHFTASQPLDPDWKVGQGLNSHPKARQIEERLPYKVIEVGKTQVEAKALYKVMLGAIVSESSLMTRQSQSMKRLRLNECTGNEVTSTNCLGRDVQC